MEVSRRVITAQWWRMFGLIILATLISLLGALACGIGLFVTLPIGFGALTIAYETLCRAPVKSA